MGTTTLGSIGTIPTETVEGYDIFILQVTRVGLENVILRYKLAGFEILYVIPSVSLINSFIPPMNTFIPANAPQPTLVPLQLSTDLLTVCLAKKDPHKDPCPRCAYPYPNSDQLAREE